MTLRAATIPAMIQDLAVQVKVTAIQEVLPALVTLIFHLIPVHPVPNPVIPVVQPPMMTVHPPAEVLLNLPVADQAVVPAVK